MSNLILTVGDKQAKWPPYASKIWSISKGSHFFRCSVEIKAALQDIQRCQGRLTKKYLCRDAVMFSPVFVMTFKKD